MNEQWGHETAEELPLKPHPIVGHSQAQQRVLSLMRHQRLPHAILITGPQGIGKKVFVRQLAALLVSHGIRAEDLFLSKFSKNLSLEGAKHVYAHTHPDVWDELTSLVALRGDRRVDDMRSFIRFFQKTPVQGSSLVGILPDLHLFNRQGLNALLKCLEEPPPASYLLLTSHKPSALPKTILSRVAKIDLSFPSSEEYRVILRNELHDCDEDVMDFLIHFSPSPGMGMRWIQLGGMSLWKTLKEFFSRWVGQQDSEQRLLPMTVIDDWLNRLKKGEISLETLLSLYQLLLNLLLVKRTPYSLQVPIERFPMCFCKIEKTQQIIREAVHYDLDHKQCLLVLFSLFMDD